MIGERLAELRKDRGLSQKELASMLSVTFRSVSYYELGKSEPNDEIKLKIAEVFNVSIDYLLGRVDEQLPYCVENMVLLPVGFPKHAKDDLLKYIDLLKTKYMMQNKE